MDEEENLTAWHESGHATMAVICGGIIERVTLEPPFDDGPNRFGDTITRWSGMTERQLMEAEIRVSLAGPIAEMIYSDENRPIDAVPEWEADWVRACEAAARLSRSIAQKRKILDSMTQQIFDSFQHDNIWTAISAVADDLLAHETLEHEQVKQTVDFWIHR
jgi:ATP-dependent Zn protease